MIRVILADDQNIVRNGIRNLLERDGRFEVIGEASSAAEVFELLDKGIIPDIVLADMILPELADFGKNFKFDGSIMPKLVLLTTADRDEQLLRAFKSGVMGYLLKSISPDELVFALFYIHHYHKKYLSAELGIHLLDQINNLPQANEYPFDGVSFSKRETEVLELISEGYTNQQIADKLFTSRRTVEGHRQALMDKADVHNSAALVKYALRHKLIS
jgi:DNA-binding NarL/FixJ family response regulator